MRLLKIPNSGDPPPPRRHKGHFKWRDKPALLKETPKKHRFCSLNTKLPPNNSVSLSYCSQIPPDNLISASCAFQSDPKRVFLLFQGVPMDMDDEDMFDGEFLNAVCRALHRNSIRSLKRAAIPPEPTEQPALKKPPQSEHQPCLPMFARGD